MEREPLRAEPSQGHDDRAGSGAAEDVTPAHPASILSGAVRRSVSGSGRRWTDAEL
uniref:Uncharacterized protein n=1 Tax=Streptomyces sp. NBC_00093 TaxID=2975649 RepID=A0AAU2AB82_9ACTN